MSDDESKSLMLPSGNDKRKEPTATISVVIRSTEIIELTREQIGYALDGYVRARLELDQEAQGLPLLTDFDGNIYAGAPDWKVASEDGELMILVDAANVLISGQVLSVEAQEVIEGKDNDHAGG